MNQKARTDGRTDKLMDEICPSNLFNVGGIINRKMLVLEKIYDPTQPSV